MNKMEYKPLVLLGASTLLMLTASVALANGGPFTIKYPGGDPAAKGILARLDPDLKPAREARLRVIKEDLKVTFGRDGRNNQQSHPLAHVVAEYTIENPTGDQVEIDFGFPILRGVFINPFSMMPSPDVKVTIGEKHIRSTIISNSAIYGIIRRRARDIIEQAVAENQALAGLVASVRGTTGDANYNARQALSAYLVDSLKWTERDAVLMVEYASLDFGEFKTHPWDRDRMAWGWSGDKELNELMNANLGPLAAIGEQKATQFFAQLAGRFDPKAAATYETIFSAWGGDVRERSVDLKTGDVRPREVVIDSAALTSSDHGYISDPTIYARVDYLDPKAKISESEKESCKAILKNLPVIFTYAPMNILHYRVSFPAKSTQTLTVSYGQYAYSDTHAPSSYQLAYVVHPASFWQDFGPINLEVAVPQGVPFRASLPCLNGGVQERQVSRDSGEKIPCEIYRAQLKQKTGEIYLAVDAEAWKNGGDKVAADYPNDRIQQAVQQTER
jgi:hypothetical protein